MCTVTYVPLADGFLLCSNRDERISRANTLPPARYVHHGRTLFYPRDEESTGTWIATSESGRTFCLLNGAFEKHISHPPYRKSRGLILLESILSEAPENYLSSGELTGIEPFTLVMAEEKSEGLHLQELRWDGNKSHLKQLDSGRPHIWSSATLYSAETCRQREQWFAAWLTENKEPQQEDLLQFHRFGGDGNPDSDLIMKRSNDRQTISITCVHSAVSGKNILYDDLISGKEYRTEIPLESGIPKKALHKD